MPEESNSFYVGVVQNMKRTPLKLIFFAHFIFMTWGVQGYWSPDSYLFYNLIFLISLLWSIFSKDEEAVIICLVINVLSILFDVIVLSVHFPRLNYSSSERFSVGMTILNLVIRPLTCILLQKHSVELSEEASSSSRPFGVPSSSKQQRGYQDIGGFQPNPDQ